MNKDSEKLFRYIYYIKDFKKEKNSDTKYLIENMSNTFIEQPPESFTEKYLKELMDLYPSIKMDLVDSKQLYSDHTITYGEMDYDGMDKLLKHLQDQNINFNYFIDIGSGRGKLPLHVASLPNVTKSIGIEVVKERHNDAEELKQKLKEFKQITDKVVFINDDFNKIELSQYINSITLVWISNLCFSQEFTNLIFNKLVEILPSGSIITASKKHFFESPKLFNLGTLQVPMSWSKTSSSIYIYKIM